MLALSVADAGCQPSLEMDEVNGKVPNDSLKQSLLRTRGFERLAYLVLRPRSPIMQRALGH